MSLPDAAGIPDRRASGARTAHRAPKAFKGSPAPRDKPGAQGPQGPQGAPGAKGEKGDKGEKGEKGDKGDKGDAAPAGLRAVQGDGAASCEANETLVSVFCPGGGAADGAKCSTPPTVGLCLRKP